MTIFYIPGVEHTVAEQQINRFIYSTRNVRLNLKIGALMHGIFLCSKMVNLNFIFVWENIQICMYSVVYNYMEICLIKINISYIIFEWIKYSLTFHVLNHLKKITFRSFSILTVFWTFRNAYFNYNRQLKLSLLILYY